MLIHLDTSILVDAFTAPRRSLRAVEEAIANGHVLTFSTMVLYEWLRGPRTDEERSIVNLQFGAERIVPFRSEDARVAANIYRGVVRARPRQGDIAIAACAIEDGAALWTLEPGGF